MRAAFDRSSNDDDKCETAENGPTLPDWPKQAPRPHLTKQDLDVVLSNFLRRRLARLSVKIDISCVG